MDRTGVIWIGTSNGANRLDTKAKQFYHVGNQPGHPGQPEPRLRLVRLGDRRRQGLGGHRIGLEHPGPGNRDRGTDLGRPDGSDNSPVTIPSSRSTRTTTGHIWLGARDGALNRYDPRTGIFHRFPVRPGSPDGPDDDRVFSIASDLEGKIWLGTMTGLECYDPETETFTLHQARPRPTPTDFPRAASVTCCWMTGADSG